MTKSPPRVIAFDGDDKLWHNETVFVMTQNEFRALVLRHADLPYEEIDARLVATERRNLVAYGYGIKGFVLSMIETAIEVTEGRISAEEVSAILTSGRAMLKHPVELLEGAQEVLEILHARDHELWLVTKGDLFDQESKIGRSGLAPLFDHVEIVSEKDEEMYRRLMLRRGISPDEFAMVGNSLRSVVLPVIGIGARAFHVPYAVTWAHEHVDIDADYERSYQTLPNLRALLPSLSE